MHVYILAISSIAVVVALARDEFVIIKLYLVR